MAENEWERRHPDWMTLSGGLLALAFSAYVLGDGFPGIRIQWILALGAVVVGVIMLVASLRTRRDR